VVRENTGVTALRPARNWSGWTVPTPAATLRCAAVIVATGPFQRPAIPVTAAELPRHLMQLHSRDYRNPEQLPEDAVLIVGTGGVV
jgi:putative flavoprotein involved in K+ transport